MTTDQEKGDGAWIANFLTLTQTAIQSAQESEATSSITAHDLAKEMGEEINLAMFGRARPHSTEGDTLSPHEKLSQQSDKPRLATQKDKSIHHMELALSDDGGDKFSSLPQTGQKGNKTINIALEQGISGNQNPSNLHTHQNTPLKGADSFTIAAQPSAENMEPGNKILAKTPLPSLSANPAAMIDKIDGVEVIRTQKQGNLTLLQLQLNPEHLGRIDARLRMDANQLMVELTTDKPQTARLLEKDQQMLMQVLEKAGVNSETRLNIQIIERSGQTLQSASSLSFTSQNDNANQTASHESMTHHREQASADFDSSAQENDENNRTKNQDQHEKTQIESLAQPSDKKKHDAFNSSRRLIV